MNQKENLRTEQKRNILFITFIDVEAYSLATFITMRNRQIKTKQKERDMSERFRISAHIFVLFYPEIRRCIFFFF
jgi:hypothetical protein